MKDVRIGLLGAGNLAGALLGGLLSSSSVSPDQLRVSDVRAQRLREVEQKYGVRALSNPDLARWCTTLILATKPQVIVQVLHEIRNVVTLDLLIISVAAGVSIKTIEAELPPGQRVVRAMPNTAAMALAAITAISPGTAATPADMEQAAKLFESVGRVIELDESLLDAVTGLSGSGPAYVMVLIDALADGGVKSGLPRDAALLLAAQTVFGSAKWLIESGQHPATLKDMVTSPGGTTIAGLHRLEEGGVRRALMDAVESATLRAKQLARAGQDGSDKE